MEPETLIVTLLKGKAEALVDALADTLVQVEAVTLSNTLALAGRLEKVDAELKPEKISEQWPM